MLAPVHEFKGLGDRACEGRAANLIGTSGAALGSLPFAGNLRGINGGAYFFTVLPEIGVEFDIPLIGYFEPGNPPDTGLVPDLLTPVTPGSLAQGSDPAMEAALEAVS